MDFEQRLTEYSTARLDGQPAPADLKAVLFAIWTDASFAGSDRDPLAIVGFRILQPGQSHPLLDNSYLNDKDRANPDIMANVAAMDGTSGLCCFVLETRNGLMGYWRGPEKAPLHEAPIVFLDDEGQYLLASGRSIAEALCFSAVSHDTTKFFDAARAAFAELGVSAPVVTYADLEFPELAVQLRQPTIEHPNNFRHRMYNEHRVMAGPSPFVPDHDWSRFC